MRDFYFLSYYSSNNQFYHQNNSVDPTKVFSAMVSSCFATTHNLNYRCVFRHFCESKSLCHRIIQIFFNAMRLALFLFSDFGLFVFCFWKLANTPHQSITVVKGWEMNDWIFAWTCHIFSETRLSSARADTIPEMLIINTEFKSWLNG